MKKIALIMDGWKRFFTYAWPSGILERIHETNEDVNLYMFNSSGNWSSDKNFNIGEYNIYNLPDLSQFDGIILELNNVTSENVISNIKDRAGAANVPVLSIANEMNDFYYVGINNRAIMKELTEHLHKEHNCQKFWLVMGPEDNYESNARLEGIKEYLDENGIEYSDDDICNCTYEFRGGFGAFERLCSKHNEMPDAIICANDNLAVAICESAREKGYSVPRDFCVTGFDNFDKAAYYSPSITTVEHIREEVGYLCADILIRIWNGEKVPHMNYTEARLVFQESCKCNESTKRDIRQYMKNQIMYGLDSEEFEENILTLEAMMMKCNTVEEMMYCIPECVPAFKCDAMYLVLDERINEYKDQSSIEMNIRARLDEGFCTDGYPQKMKVVFAYENGQKVDVPIDEIDGLFPMFDIEKGGKDILFVPLHFGKYTIGYFAIVNAVYLMDRQYLFQTRNILTSALENLHKKEKLEYMNRKLSTLYMIDPLTNMYNRMGYQKLGKNYFDILNAKEKSIHILFIDLDRLKYINDSFGHEYGDFAICAVARAITKYSDMDAVPSRTGGDEFILIQSYKSDEECQKLIHNIRAALDEESKNMNLPFELSISVGSVVTDPTNEISLEEWVKQADNKMYEEKVAKKANRK